MVRGERWDHVRHMLRHLAGFWIFMVVPKHRHLECLSACRFSKLTAIETARGDPRAFPASSLPGQQKGQPASLKATWPLLFLAFQFFQTREEVRPQQLQPLSFGPLLAVMQGGGYERERVQPYRDLAEGCPTWCPLFSWATWNKR